MLIDIQFLKGKKELLEKEFIQADSIKNQALTKQIELQGQLSFINGLLNELEKDKIKKEPAAEKAAK